MHKLKIEKPLLSKEEQTSHLIPKKADSKSQEVQDTKIQKPSKGNKEPYISSHKQQQEEAKNKKERKHGFYEDN
jgi:hypothetical protein